MTGAFLHHARTRVARARAEELLDFAGLTHVAGARAGTLGTPARKRLEIARALATEPQLLLLDEALAGLTPTEARAAIELVRAIHARGISLIIVEHLMEVILSLTHRVVVFNQGRVIAEGEPREVMENPAVIEAYLGRSSRRRRRPRTASTSSRDRADGRRHDRGAAAGGPRARGALWRPGRRLFGLAGGRARRGGGDARLERRRQDDDAERDRRPGDAGGRRGPVAGRGDPGSPRRTRSSPAASRCRRRAGCCSSTRRSSRTCASAPPRSPTAAAPARCWTRSSSYSRA